MEGMPLKELLGDAWTTELEKGLHQKVVLVEFWGTWCGPCKMFIPELERLQQKYDKQGFQVLGIHSQSGHQKANDYLAQHPKPWPNLIDEDRTLEERFHVPHFPSLYLVGPDGNIRGVLAHHLGLDRAIEMLLTD